MSCNQLGVHGAEALALALPTSSLTKLDLSENALFSEGMEALASSIAASSSLTELVLASNRLSGVWVDRSGQYGAYSAEGLHAITRAMNGSPSLTKVDLSGNHLTSSDARALEEANQRMVAPVELIV